MSFGKNVLRTPSKIWGCGLANAEVGIEIELEGSGFGNCTGWNTHNEGSVQGIEYVTKPTQIDKVKGLVDKLRLKLEQDMATVRHTHRTSTHIHMNVSQFPLSTVLGFMTVFVMFEPLLMRLCGSQRDGNLFCLSSYDTGDIAGFMSRFCKSIDRMDNYGLSPQRGKYSSLNILRLQGLGTLECRCFPSTLDGDTVTKWCRWLQKMLDIAKAEPDKSFRSLWKTIRLNPNHYAIEIFGSDAFSVPDAAGHIDFGTENAYELTRVLKHWYAKPIEDKATVKAAPAKKARLSSATALTPNQINEWFVAQTSPQPMPWAAAPSQVIEDDASEF